MEAVIGQIDYGRTQVLHGDHHIVITKKIKLEQGAYPPGTVYSLDASLDLVPHLNASPTLTVDCVLLEQIDTGTTGVPGPDDAAPMCVHGVVRKEKLVDINGDLADAAAIAALKALGIHAV